MSADPPRKSERLVGGRKPPRTAIGIARDLFERLDADAVPLGDVARRAGTHHNTLSYWRSGRRSPTLINFEALAQAAGYRLVLEPIGQEKTADDRL